MTFPRRHSMSTLTSALIHVTQSRRPRSIGQLFPIPVPFAVSLFLCFILISFPLVLPYPRSPGFQAPIFASYPFRSCLTRRSQHTRSPRDPEQETEVGHRQRPDEYRHGVVLRRHRELPDDHSQDQQVAGDADDEDGTRIESGNISK